MPQEASIDSLVAILILWYFQDELKVRKRQEEEQKRRLAELKDIHTDFEQKYNSLEVKYFLDNEAHKAHPNYRIFL